MTSKNISNLLVLTVGVVLLWWGANWQVALGGYTLAAWAYKKQIDAWEDFSRALDAQKKTIA